MNDNREVADVDTTAQPPATAVSFDGRRGELAGLLFRNLLLTLATLGIYRFWAKTRVRGFLWRHVKLLDEPLEDLGSGTELLIGFLIAVVVIAPLTSVFSWLPALIPEGPRYSGLVLQALYYGTLGFLVQVAVYRVRRYRLTRTAWRGVRFGLEGSAFKYALIWCLYGAVTLATLGLAYPWLRVATTRYFANNARFGTTVFSFDGTAGRLFLRWLVVVAPATAAILLFVLVNAEALADFWSQTPVGVRYSMPRPFTASTLRSICVSDCRLRSRGYRRRDIGGLEGERGIGERPCRRLLFGLAKTLMVSSRCSGPSARH